MQPQAPISTTRSKLSAAPPISTPAALRSIQALIKPSSGKMVASSIAQQQALAFRQPSTAGFRGSWWMPESVVAAAAAGTGSAPEAHVAR